MVGQSLKALDPDLVDDRYFHRVRLPWSRFGHLMWLLAVEGVNAATIYPGYKGVVMTLEEERTRP